MARDNKRAARWKEKNFPIFLSAIL